MERNVRSTYIHALPPGFAGGNGRLEATRAANAQIREAQDNRNTALAQVSVKRAELDYADKQYKRSKALIPSGAVSEQEMEVDRARAEVARSAPTRKQLSAVEVEKILYRQSGLLGLAGTSNDICDLLASEASGAQLAVDYLVYRACKEIGAMAAVHGGLDGMIFTAGIGERSAEIRRRILTSCAWLGIELDSEANARHGPRVSRAGSAVSAWIIPTDEELMIARHTVTLLGLVEARA